MEAYLCNTIIKFEKSIFRPQCFGLNLNQVTAKVEIFIYFFFFLKSELENYQFEYEITQTKLMRINLLKT